MKGIANSEIAWICPWWKLKYATLEHYDHCVPIPGLHLSTFITPSRLFHQYGCPSSLWLFYPTSKVFPSGRISWIKWRLCGPIDHWRGIHIWLMMLLPMTITKFGLLCRLQNHQNHLSTKGLKCCWMSLKRRNKNINKTNSLIVLVFMLSYFIFPFSTLCIVIKIEYAMFSKNSISITFIN